MKTNITLSLDVKNISECKIRKLNISQTVNNLLKTYLDLPEDSNEKIKENILKKIELKSAELADLRNTLNIKEKEDKKDPYKNVILLEK